MNADAERVPPPTGPRRATRSADACDRATGGQPDREPDRVPGRRPSAGSDGDPDRGSGLVAGIALIFALTFLGLVWLARDVDRSISNRSAASSVAFQAARSGAQAAHIPTLRAGRSPVIDAEAAHAAATATAHRLLTGYGATGSVSVDVGTDHVTATVTITEAGRTVTGVATVEARRVP